MRRRLMELSKGGPYLVTQKHLVVEETIINKLKKETVKCQENKSLFLWQQMKIIWVDVKEKKNTLQFVQW